MRGIREGRNWIPTTTHFTPPPSVFAGTAAERSSSNAFEARNLLLARCPEQMPRLASAAYLGFALSAIIPCKFDSLCRTEVTFFLIRVFFNILAMVAVMKFYRRLRDGFSWKDPEEIELYKASKGLGLRKHMGLRETGFSTQPHDTARICMNHRRKAGDDDGDDYERERERNHEEGKNSTCQMISYRRYIIPPFVDISPKNPELLRIIGSIPSTFSSGRPKPRR
ncbi:unnamed protein product [Notodromas monacha]|uniref:Uncharacterized protein n=1 Tax=Notodromas monacha TaxID=399045 RepID=A0A7R9BYJ0_9CRUS|nr:unnamed protein product [Notodromas monacha]CAG0922789.1 unnamed protein product [Notodromas monacha]